MSGDNAFACATLVGMTHPRIHTLPSDYRAALIPRLGRWSRATVTGCIEWTGALNRYGYGKIKLAINGKQRSTSAHRAAWLTLVGDIEGDLVVDHLCRNRSCINVDHMELVTGAENTRRGTQEGKKGRSGTKSGMLLHSCSKHGRDDGKLVTERTGYVKWRCRECHRAYGRAFRERQKARQVTA